MPTRTGDHGRPSPTSPEALRDKEGCQLIEGDRITREYVQQGKLPRVDLTKIIEHIDHAVKLAGADHVGSDQISTAPICLMDGGCH